MFLVFTFFFSLGGRVLFFDGGYLARFGVDLNFGYRALRIADIKRIYELAVLLFELAFFHCAVGSFNRGHTRLIERDRRLSRSLGFVLFFSAETELHAPAARQIAAASMIENNAVLIISPPLFVEKIVLDLILTQNQQNRQFFSDWNSLFAGPPKTRRLR